MTVSTDHLIPRLQELSARHQLLFALCCCERVLPLYCDFAEDEGWDDADFLEGITQRLWASLQGKAIPAAEARALRKKIIALPLDDESCKSGFLGMAQDAAGAVWVCLELAIRVNEKALKHVASLALSVAKEWIGMVSDLDPTGEARDYELARRWKLEPPKGAYPARLQSEAETEYAQNRFVQAECDKQRFDVEVLEKHRRITPTLMKLLRRSSQLQGVQVRRRCLRATTQR